MFAVFLHPFSRRVHSRLIQLLYYIPHPATSLPHLIVYVHFLSVSSFPQSFHIKSIALILTLTNIFHRLLSLSHSFGGFHYLLCHNQGQFPSSVVRIATSYFHGRFFEAYSTTNLFFNVYFIRHSFFFPCLHPLYI